MRMLLAIIAIAGLCAAGDDHRPRVLSDYMTLPENVGVSLVNAALPLQALSQQDVDRWATMLNASEEQAEAMRFLYARFVERHNEFMDRQVPAFIEESSAMAHASVEFNLELVEKMKSLRIRSSRICESLEQIEHAFIDELSAILTDEQRDSLQTLRLESTRRAHRTFASTVRWGDVDLRQIWEHIHADVSLAQQARVHEVLAEYEVQLTPLVRRQSEAYWDRPIRVVPILIQHRAGLLTDSAYEAAYRRTHRRHLNAGRAIRHLTQATFDRIVDALPADVAATFEGEVKRHVFPEVYPDKTALHALFAAILDRGDLNDEDAADVQAIFAGYAERHAKLCNELEALCLKWGDEAATGNADYHDADLPDALAPLLAQRRELANQTLQALRLKLGDAALREQIDMLPTLSPSDATQVRQP